MVVQKSQRRISSAAQVSGSLRDDRLFAGADLSHAHAGWAAWDEHVDLLGPWGVAGCVHPVSRNSAGDEAGPVERAGAVFDLFLPADCDYWHRPLRGATDIAGKNPDQHAF